LTIDHGPSSIVPLHPSDWTIEFYQPSLPLKLPPDLTALGSETDPASGLPLRVKNELGLVFRLIPAGRFKMGSASGDGDENPMHNSTISQPFWEPPEITSGV
jgi:formylglycine-generating enzyme required for sulfatase activity